MLEVTKKRAACVREDFLVRGIGKRAIHVVVPYTANGTRMSDLLTEFELYWLIHAAAKFISKRGWKVGTVKIPYFETLRFTFTATVEVNNCSGFTTTIGSYENICTLEHFLNDPYYYPKGHYIKERTNQT